MEEQYHTPYRVQVHQIFALGAHLLGAHGIGAARGKCAAAPRNIETIVSGDLELTHKKRVGGFLKATIRASNDHRVRPCGRPSELRLDCHVVPLTSE
jgi:hypothetical protein